LGPNGRAGAAAAAREPHFDHGQIQQLVNLIGAHNVAGREWFESAGTEPYPVRYAEPAADPAGLAAAPLGRGRALEANHGRPTTGG
jgi:LPS sulfotransferase NodH